MCVCVCAVILSSSSTKVSYRLTMDYFFSGGGGSGGVHLINKMPGTCIGKDLSQY